VVDIPQRGEHAGELRGAGFGRVELLREGDESQDHHLRGFNQQGCGGDEIGRAGHRGQVQRETGRDQAGQVVPLQENRQGLLLRVIQLRGGQAGAEQVAAVHTFKAGIGHHGHRSGLPVRASAEPHERRVEVRDGVGKLRAGPLQQGALEDDVTYHGAGVAGRRSLTGGGAAGAVEHHGPALRAEALDGFGRDWELTWAETLHVAGHRPGARLRGQGREHVAQRDIELVA